MKKWKHYVSLTGDETDEELERMAAELFEEMREEMRRNGEELELPQSLRRPPYRPHGTT